jgi:DNA topoisomerase-1
LVKALEEKGIGRPSTYAAIMTTIQDREYVERVEGRFHPTPLGTTVNELLVASFADLFNETYTARMEENLDEIEEGNLNWRTALRDFYDKFSVDLKNAEESIKTRKKASIPTDEICEKCGSGMVIKFGRFGQFLACENYPECKTTREVASKKTESASAGGENQTAEGAEQSNEVPVCELCGKEMALKKGRFGSFYGCTGYPDCKNIRKIARGEQKPQAPPVELDEECPKDGAKLVRRQGRFGEFVSCSNYPKCDAVFWDKPVVEPCPKCHAPYLLEKTTKKEGTIRYCNNESCDYKMTVSSGLSESVTEAKAEGSGLR